VQLVAEWGAPAETTLFAEASFALDEETRAALATRRIAIETDPIVQVSAVEGDGIAVQLVGGRTITKRALFVPARVRMSSPFAMQLGCALEVGPLGEYYRTDATKETTVTGVFACGEAALPMGSVAFVVADGALAGAAVHRSLVFAKA
jgi:thioredoxin reductase